MRGVLDTTLCDKSVGRFKSNYRAIMTLYTNGSRLGLWCLMSHSTIFQLYRGCQFFLVEETGVPGEKPPTCRKSLTNFIT
jgi:hypothetical protein